MTGAEVLDIARDGIWVLIIVSAPMMIVGLVVGVVIALFQALTQIQEMTLVFVPEDHRDLRHHAGRAAVHRRDVMRRLHDAHRRHDHHGRLG